MQITPSLKRTLNLANRKIDKLSQKSETLIPYFNEQVINGSYRTYRNIFHKMWIKISLCFCGKEENLFNINKKREFLKQLDESIIKLKIDKKNEGSLIRAYTSNAEKSDVLVMFRDFFDGYKSFGIEAHGDYLQISFTRQGIFASSEPEFYLCVFIEIDTRNRFSPTFIEKERPGPSHTSPTFPRIKITEAQYGPLNSISPRTEDSFESPRGKHSPSTYDTIPIESIDKINYDFLYLVKTHEKSFFSNQIILERLEISDKNLLKLKDEIHRCSFLKKENDLKVIYIVYLLNLLTLKCDEFEKRRNEFLDGILLLRDMQKNILDLQIELNFSFWLMIEYDLLPHTVLSIKEYFMLICKDKLVFYYLRDLDRNYF